MSQEQFLSADALNELGADDLLNLDISQLKDVEGFNPIPTALYGFTVKGFEIDTVGADDKTAIKMELELLECMEVGNEAEQEEVDGLEFPRTFNSMFVLEGTKGFAARNFATMFREIASQNNVSTISEILEHAVGATGAILIKRSTYKDKNTGEQKVQNQLETNTVQWA